MSKTIEIMTFRATKPYAKYKYMAVIEYDGVILPVQFFGNVAHEAYEPAIAFYKDQDKMAAVLAGKSMQVYLEPVKVVESTEPKEKVLTAKGAILSAKVSGTKWMVNSSYTQRVRVPAAEVDAYVKAGYKFASPRTKLRK